MPSVGKFIQRIRTFFKTRRDRRKQRVTWTDIERWRLISEGKMEVPVVTSDKGIQHIEIMDLLASPKFRKQLAQAKAMRERQEAFEAQGYRVSYDELGQVYLEKRPR